MMSVSDIDWQMVYFDQLNSQTLYHLLQLRSQVFVVEQHCPYLDIDGLDQNAIHILGIHKENVIAYARIVKKDDHVTIGRVTVAQELRSEGIGKVLMKKAIQTCINDFPQKPILISAQSYLTEFYQKLGFVNQGQFYLEDDIPHQTMIYQHRQ